MNIRLLCLASCLLAATAGGADLYVATSGEDTPDCSDVLNPCLTVAHAVGVAAPDDSIHIAAGSYFEKVTLDKDLSLLGDGADTTSLGWMAWVITVESGISATLEDLFVRGLYNDGGTATLDRCSVSNNGAYDQGGGVYNNAGNVTLNNSTVAYNTAGYNSAAGGGDRGEGGGLYNNGGSLTLINTTVSNNRATDGWSAWAGGGLYNNGGDVTLSNVTLVDNRVDSRGDGAGIFNTAGGSVWLEHTLLARNEKGVTANDCVGELTSGGYNLIGAPTCSVVGDLTGNITGVAPLIGELTGAPTRTHRLLAGSPALDAGDPVADSLAGEAVFEGLEQPG